MDIMAEERILRKLAHTDEDILWELSKVQSRYSDLEKETENLKRELSTALDELETFRKLYADARIEMENKDAVISD